MKLALLSDIHGNLPALEAVVADIRRRGIDDIVNLGDSLSGPLLPLETARYLIEHDWPTLAGNHERQLLTLGPDRLGASDAYAHGCLGERELGWLGKLPGSLRLAPGVLLCHGSPRSDVEYFLETLDAGGMRLAHAEEIELRLSGEDAALIACGHTHLQRAVRTARGQLIVNPGSVGLPAYSDDHPFAHVVETGSPDARYAIAEKTDAGWMATLVAVPYDFASMARLALRNGRPDWEQALLSGYVRPQ